MSAYRQPGSKRLWRRFLLFGIFFGFLGLGKANAKLGETARGCEKIYGKAVGSTIVPGLIPNGLEFHRGEYSIICGFEDNRCTVVVVLRLSPENPTEQGILREDITLFMEENFGGTSWSYTRLNKREKLWKTYDWRNQRTCIASYARPLRMLTLQVVEG